MGSCVFCSREINNKGSLKSHENVCSNNPNKVTHKRSPNSGRKKGSEAWNKGLSLEVQLEQGLITQESFDSSVAGNYKGGCNSLGVSLTEEGELSRKSKISEKMKAYGGYREGSGRGIKGWYKGIFCDSSWELAYVLYNVELKGMSVVKNTTKFPYTIDGITRNYIPDFILEDGSYVEIKGYVTDIAKEKIRQFPDKIVMYENIHMKRIIDIVKAEFGKDFTRLYENN